MKELKRKVREFLDERLSVFFFQRKQGWNFIRVVEDNVIQIIGATFSSHHESSVIYINPVIGVIYKDMNQIEAQLGMPDLLRGYTPMAGNSLGYLCPEKKFKEWRFTLGDTDEFIKENVYELAETIIKYGFPYLQNLSDTEYFIGQMSDIESRYHLPVFYYLHGKKEQALEYIDETVKKLSIPSAIDEESKIIMELYGIEPEVVADNRELLSYMPFVENFRKFVNEYD